MKRYISAATKKTYNKDELLTSIYYLFDAAAKAAGASQDDVEITKINVRKNTRPVSYTASITYTYQNKHGYINLFDVPINSTIPEDYWITAESYSRRSYFDQLIQAFDVSKIPEAKKAFNEFCNTVDSISSKYGLTYEYRSYPKNIDSLEPDETFIICYADLVDAETGDANIEFAISDEPYRRVIVTDKLSGHSVTSNCDGFSLDYRIDKKGFVKEILDTPTQTIESLVSGFVTRCRSKIDEAVTALQTSEEYQDRMSEIASLIESIPGITVNYSDKLQGSPCCNFRVSGPFGTFSLWIDNVFEADDKKLIKNLKARIRRYNSKPSDNTFKSSSETLFSKE